MAIVESRLAWHWHLVLCTLVDSGTMSEDVVSIDATFTHAEDNMDPTFKFSESKAFVS